MPWQKSPRDITKFKHFTITVLYSSVWNQSSPSVTALSTCEPRVMKRTYLSAKRIRPYLVKEQREEGEGRYIYTKKDIGRKHKSYFAKQEKLI